MVKAKKGKKISIKIPEHRGIGLGILLIAISLFWLGKELGMLPLVPFWPAVMLIVGLWIFLVSALKMLMD